MAPDAPCRPTCQTRRCGDGVVDRVAGEVCDDGNLASGDGCRGDCASLETCGNGQLDLAAGEACDDGNDDDDDACRSDCTIPGCGDGIVDAARGEACDDGPANSAAPDASCRPTCQRPRCGDDVRDVLAGEICDDGNLASGDGCSADCLSDETCGNGRVDAAVGEQCDDGNLIDADGCQATCRVARCGDGIVDADNGEACDCGDDPLAPATGCATSNSAAPDAACRPTCQAPRCGDGVVDADGGEVCDDANIVAGDGCSPDCRSDERCGNGVVDFVAGETCDDGGTAAHDGCDPACHLETQRWSLITQSATVGARTDYSLAYDVRRSRLVLFGGWSGAVARNDVWEWDGSSWLARATAAGPGPRWGATFIHDPARGKTVLFGGAANSSVVLADTWEWDGERWERKVTTSGPSARSHAAGAFASTYGVAMMFGGCQPGGDTCGIDSALWSWDGASWRLEDDGSAGPLPVGLSGMAYAPASASLLIVGGDRSLTAAPEAWLATPRAASGAAWWTPLTSPFNVPTYTALASLVSDGDLGAIAVLADATELRTARFDGSAWLTVGSSPFSWGERISAGPGGSIVGVRAATGELLSFSTTWSPAGASSTPGGRLDHAFAQAGPDSLIMFGGFDGARRDDTWRWQDGRWTQLAPATRPSARRHHAMAYDSVRQRVVLFGGDDGTVRDDTWEWNGTTWELHTPAVRPSARVGHAMAFDAGRGKVVLFGGANSSTYKDDTWLWDGTTWTQLALTVRPPPRREHVLAYDAAHGELLLYGGFFLNSSDGRHHVGARW
ncbi:MAG: kelch repeat-containing protein [Kofleriaceae bacterium]